ncbi:hypothetical protein X474_05505 [Dethiosulfatarculus sandiegensis]|uniref:Uncharacterized protein n=1 Tax=Dethiosulfatarculus sandiegensis TaxID=1429043 RepID=A0A0D2GKF5_9BACT|nr:hypothetical protein X474_05505 [Dethiosulfatarculus sandiegensis]
MITYEKLRLLISSLSAGHGSPQNTKRFSGPKWRPAKLRAFFNFAFR